MMMTNLAGPVGIALQAAAEPLTAAPSWLQAQEAFHWVIAIPVSLVLIYAGGLAYLILMHVLAPGVTGRSARIVREKPFKSLLVGLLVLAVMAVLVRVTAKAHVLAVLSIPLSLVLFFGGVSAIAQELGTRAFSMAGRSVSVLGALAVGWGIAMLGSAVPVLGWVVGGLILLPMGAGGFLLAFFTRPGEAKADVALVVEAPASPPPAGVA